MKDQSSKIKNQKLKINIKYLLFLICIFNILYLIFNFNIVYSSGISLSLSPSLLKIKMNPGTNYKSPITLINQSLDPLNIQIILKPFQPFGEDGQIRYPPAGETAGNYQNLFNNVHITDDGIIISHFIIAPQQTKNLELNINIPENENAFEDYYFSLIFLASPEANKSNTSPSIKDYTSPQDQDEIDQKNITTFNAGISANILLSINSAQKNQPDPSPQISILEFKAPSFIQNGPVNFDLRLKNNSPHYINPEGYILINNMFGQTIGKVDIASANILAGSTRYLTDTNYASRSALASPLQTNKILWKEKFLLGPYTATLNIKLSDQNLPLTSTTFFLAIPFWIIITIIITMIIIPLLILRVRYLLKNDA